MIPKRLFFCLILMWPLQMAACRSAGPVMTESLRSPAGTTTTFILIRHAERDDNNPDSFLTPKGRQRARDLVQAIGDKGITAIYTPNRGRNRETVRQLAEHLGLTVQVVSTERLSNTHAFADAFVRDILRNHAGGTVVWVGNKSPVGIWGDNINEIYHRLGAEGSGPSRYSDLFIVTVPDNGPVRVEKTSYGVQAGRFDQ